MSSLPFHGYHLCTVQMRLLVVVFSAPDHTARRDVIRKTWGKEMLKLPGVKMVFNFGKSRTIEQQVRICQMTCQLQTKLKVVLVPTVDWLQL